MLTAAERKKVRRQRRLEEHRETQEKINLGLLPPEPTKLKIANLSKALGMQSAQEPSRTEAEVRAQNNAPTPKPFRSKPRTAAASEGECRRTESTQKIGTSPAVESHVAVFRVRDLSTPQWRFKLNINAKQNHLTGCVLLYENINVVIVRVPLPISSGTSICCLIASTGKNTPKTQFVSTLKRTNVTWCGKVV